MLSDAGAPVDEEVLSQQNGEQQQSEQERQQQQYKHIKDVVRLVIVLKAASTSTAACLPHEE